MAAVWTAVGLTVLVMFGGCLSALVIYKPWDVAAEAPEVVRPMPELVIGEKLKATGVQFGIWHDGFLTYSTNIRLPADREDVHLREDAITVEAFGWGDVKLPRAFSDHQPLKAGESARLTIYLTRDKDDAAKIVLDLR